MAQLSLLRKCLPFTLLLLATVTTIRAIPTVAQPHPTTLDHSAQNSQPQHPPELMQAQVPGLPMWVYLVGTAVLILFFLPKIGWIAGLIVIGEREHKSVAVLINFGLALKFDRNPVTTNGGLSHGYAPLEQYKSSVIWGYYPDV